MQNPATVLQGVWASEVTKKQSVIAKILKALATQYRLMFW